MVFFDNNWTYQLYIKLLFWVEIRFQKCKQSHIALHCNGFISLDKAYKTSYKLKLWLSFLLVFTCDDSPTCKTFFLHYLLHQNIIFNTFLFFTKWYPFKNYETCFLFHQKSSFHSLDIQIFVFPFSHLFVPVSHCFRAWSKINLKVCHIIKCLNKNLITHFIWYLEKEKRYDIFFFFFLNWDSLHARLNNCYKAWSYKKSRKKITGYRKSV